MDDKITEFHNAISKGPLYICTCCEQLLYRDSLYQDEGISLDQNWEINLNENRDNVDNPHVE